MHRTFLVTLLTACSLIAGCAARHTWVLAPGQHPQSFERRVTVETHGRFLLYLPAGFDPSGRTHYPLLIFLHGSGESGEDLEKVKVHGPPKLVASKPDFPFIVASPQARNSIERFDPATLDAMLDELLEQLPIDPDRVYLTGLSMGGMWTYGWAIQHPKRFAAIAPVCGGDARLTVYLYTGHDSWNQAYADPELYQWLLQQRRRAVRKP